MRIKGYEKGCVNMLPAKQWNSCQDAGLLMTRKQNFSRHIPDETARGDGGPSDLMPMFSYKQSGWTKYRDSRRPENLQNQSEVSYSQTKIVVWKERGQVQSYPWKPQLCDSCLPTCRHISQLARKQGHSPRCSNRKHCDHAMITCGESCHAFIGFHSPWFRAPLIPVQHGIVTK